MAGHRGGQLREILRITRHLGKSPILAMVFEMPISTGRHIVVNRDFRGIALIQQPSDEVAANKPRSADDKEAFHYPLYSRYAALSIASGPSANTELSRGTTPVSPEILGLRIVWSNREFRAPLFGVASRAIALRPRVGLELDTPNRHTVARSAGIYDLASIIHQGDVEYRLIVSIGHRAPNAKPAVWQLLDSQ